MAALMDKELSYRAVAYYYIGPIEDPQAEVKRHREFFRERDIKCRIYVADHGINGQMSARKDHAAEYMEWMRSDPRFSELPFKLHEIAEHAFPKTTVKIRRQLVAMDCDVDLSKRASHVSPAEWKKMLEEKGKETILIDVRNSYESAVGYFEGAERPSLETFRQFPEYARKLKEARDPKNTVVMMYCTGGIRCEFYSALMKQEGFDKIYQLDGGVIEYGLKEGSAHWKGKLFVFDDRLAVPISDEHVEPIAPCRHCNEPNDVYYNCANMDCNELFLCCEKCLPVHKGCCSDECQKGRIRPWQLGGKPFKKWSFEEKQAMKASCQI